MEPRSLAFIARACGGELAGGSPELSLGRICTDSRQVQSGDLFFALAGEHFDGHAFLGEVVKRAAAVVVERRRLPAGLSGCAMITVSDTRQALGALASEYRREFTLPVVAVGGSNGKTTTKELIASVLRQKLKTLSSEASFNNDIGVPLTLLRLETAHEAAVLEAGTNHPGELEPLLRMIAPRYGMITSIGREHLEFFGDLAGVTQEEGWMGEFLPAAGKLWLHAPGEWATAIQARTRATVVRVGSGARDDLRATQVRLESRGVVFRVEAPMAAWSGEYRVNLLGKHQAINALFAIGLGAELGLSAEQIQRGLAECKPAKMRMQLWEHNGVRVLDDAYNANADSMAAALETFQALPCKGRRVAVLGDMAELGAQSEAAHEEVGRRAAELGVGQLFAVGKMASIMARGAREAGLNRVFVFGDADSAAAAVRSFVKRGDMLLLKASRATHLERVAEKLRTGDAARKN